MTKKEKETILPALDHARASMAILIMSMQGIPAGLRVWAAQTIRESPLTGTKTKELLQDTIRRLDELKEMADEE